jgi:hypothetical protein
VAPEGTEREPKFQVDASFGYKSALVELRLAELLGPGDKCAILDRRGNALTHFSVSDEVDEEAPRGAYIGGGSVHFEDNDSTCEVRGAQSDIEVRLDDEKAEELVHVSFAVYASFDGAPLDYDAPPTTWITSHRYRNAHAIQLLGGEACNRGGNFPYPPAGHSAKLGLVPVDLAGNRGTKTEALLPGLSANAKEVTVLPLNEAPPDPPVGFPSETHFLWALLGGTLIVAALVVGFELRD